MNSYTHGINAVNPCARGANTMTSCVPCDAADSSHDARRAIRRDPITHVHRGIAKLPWDPKLASDYELVYPVTEFNIEIAYGFIIMNRVHGLRDIYPVGLSLYNSYGLMVVIGHEPVVAPHAHMHSYRTSDLISRHARKYYSRVQPQLRLPLLRRTGVWANWQGERVFTDLTGVIPPLRRTLGPLARAVVFADVVHIAVRTRSRARTRTRALVRWSHHNHIVMRVRARRGFTVDRAGNLIADNGVTADAYI